MALPITYNIRNLFVRWKVTLLAICGIGLVVVVFVVLLSMATGFRLALSSTGSTQNAIVVQQGSTSELTSGFSREQAELISVDDRVARGKDGRPLASPEIMVLVNLTKRATGMPTNVTVRAVTQKAFEVRSDVKIVEGRNFTSGLYEIVVGKRIQERIAGLDIGSKVSVMKHDFVVVGVITASGSSFESEIWGDLDVMGPAFNRAGGQSSVRSPCAWLTPRVLPGSTLISRPILNSSLKCMRSASITTIRPDLQRTLCWDWQCSSPLLWASGPYLAP
ncbi:MAG: hypothetical protein DMG67_11375 [Acidobacteria bacterium]|nr:MAG: hypothetical protein DMG67_11375 [Acidobacteriota bacterium]